MEGKIKIALIGNPNCGKSSLFNALTGSRQHVGNWPGKTVEKKEGYCNYNGTELEIVDLPGTYSLTAYSIEEVITRDYLINEKPDAVISVIDASNLERNLYLTIQVLEMGIPTIVALNMADLAKANGISIDIDQLQNALAAPIVETIASEGAGITDLLSSVVSFIGEKSG
jgi:ferrous iron transport protein B